MGFDTIEIKLVYFQLALRASGTVLVLRHLFNGQMFEETFVQGDTLLRRCLSKETFVQGVKSEEF